MATVAMALPVDSSFTLRPASDDTKTSALTLRETVNNRRLEEWSERQCRQNLKQADCQQTRHKRQRLDWNRPNNGGLMKVPPPQTTPFVSPSFPSRVSSEYSSWHTYHHSYQDHIRYCQHYHHPYPPPTLRYIVPPPPPPASPSLRDDELLYRDFIPPQNERYWKRRCMYMQDVCRDTRSQMRNLQEDHRQLRHRVWELEEQLLQQMNHKVLVKETSAPAAAKEEEEAYHGDSDERVDKEDTRFVVAGSNVGVSPDRRRRHRCRHHASDDDVGGSPPHSSPNNGGSPSLFGLYTPWTPPPPTVVVTSAVQHRMVSSCLYMTDGEGLSDGGGSDDGCHHDDDDEDNDEEEESDDDRDDSAHR